MCASFEKMVLGAEMLQMLAELARPVATDDAALALPAHAEVAPGGHFFAAAHTLARYETAFYAPLLAEGRGFDAWQEGGAEDTARRACRIWQELLASYQPPPLDAARREALEAFVAGRRAEIERHGL